VCGIVCQKEMSREREKVALVMGGGIRLAVSFERVAGGLGQPGAERPASDDTYADPAAYLAAADHRAGIHGYAYAYGHYFPR
jgi:hypothetical protein